MSSSDDEVNILDSGDEVSGPVGFRPDDVKDSLDLGFAEAAATLDPDVCESLLTFCECSCPYISCTHTHNRLTAFCPGLPG